MLLQLPHGPVGVRYIFNGSISGRCLTRCAHSALHVNSVLQTINKRIECGAKRSLSRHRVPALFTEYREFSHVNSVALVASSIRLRNLQCLAREGNMLMNRT